MGFNIIKTVSSNAYEFKQIYIILICRQILSSEKTYYIFAANKNLLLLEKMQHPQTFLRTQKG